MQNNKNSIIAPCWDYRAQAVVLFDWAVALLTDVDVLVLLLAKLAVIPALPVVAGPVADPLLQVGQLYVLDVLLENDDVLD
jgi:hypothetical protein